MGLIVTNGYHTYFWICHSFLDKYIYNVCIYTYKNHIIWNKLASIYIINGYMRDGLSISTLSPVLRRSPNKTKKTFWQLCSEKCLRIGAIFSQQQFCCVFLRSDTPIFDQTKTLFWLFPNRFPNRFNFTKEQKEEEEEEVEEDY